MLIVALAVLYAQYYIYLVVFAGTRKAPHVCGGRT